MAAKLFSTEVANLLALAILISTTLMAALSFGSYRNLINTKNSKLKSDYYNSVRRAVFAVNLLLVLLVCLAFSLLIDFEKCAIIFLFVINEHIIHDESRIHLYKGERRKWACNNFLRTTFIPIVPLLAWYFSQPSIEGILIFMLAFTVFNLSLSRFRGGLMALNYRDIVLITKKYFLRRYLLLASYFVSSVFSKGAHQSDRYLISIIFYNELWVYSLLSQIANIPLVFFEMGYLSKFKSELSQHKYRLFQWLEKKQVAIMFLVSVLSFFVYMIVGMYTDNFFEQKYIILFIIILFSNLISSTCMLNNESLFWLLNKPSQFSALESKAVILGYGLSLPVVIFLNTMLLVKLPSLLTNLFRINNAWKYLKK